MYKMCLQDSDQSGHIIMHRDVATAGGGGRQSPALRFRAHH